MPGRVFGALGATGKFPRTARVRRRREFARVQEDGLRIHTDAFTIIANPNDEPRARLGCAVGRKVGGAVVRNRIRRILKELFRRRASDLPPIDVVIIAKSNAARLSREGFDAVAGEVDGALANAIAGLARREEKRKPRST